MMPYDLSPFGERSGLRYMRHYGHIAEDAVLMEDGTLCAVIAVPGCPFELADPRQLNAHHTVHAALLRAVADDDVQLYEHLVQHDAVPSMLGGEMRRAGYAAELAEDYARSCLGGLRETTWLVTLLVHPRFAAGGWRGVLGMTPRARDLEHARRGGPTLERRRARLEERARAVLTALPGARRLGVRIEADIAFSEIAEAKRLFHCHARAQLVKLAKALGLDPSQFDLRSNGGGIAVSSEITLHADRLYVQASQPATRADTGILFRSCEGRRDYTGGRNNFASLDLLHRPDELATLIRRHVAF